MANYLLLYHGGSMPEGEDAQKQVMDAWGAWFGQLGDSLVDGGNPTMPAAKSISSDGSTSDASGGNPATGYSVIKADSMDQAVEKAKGCPVLGGGSSITVYETIAM
ncbi:MAG TPA: hypothetical protein VGR61_03245 [Candidatus Dormibacteraeota bacterium]|nr:hypothetical protein [Candidatus Dormibacteraeota bacterium]